MLRREIRVNSLASVEGHVRVRVAEPYGYGELQLFGDAPRTHGVIGAGHQAPVFTTEQDDAGISG